MRASLHSNFANNPDEDEQLIVQMFYNEGKAFWERGQLFEFYNFFEADHKLDFLARYGHGEVMFSIYVFGDLVYVGTYDLDISPADLKRQVVLYLDQLDTDEAHYILGVLAEKNPVKLDKGYVDPDTGAWMSRRRFDEGINEAITIETVTEDPNIIDDINQALLAGTIGIGQSGLVTAASRERMDTGEGEPDDARIRERLALRRRDAARRETEEARERTEQQDAARRDQLAPDRLEELSISHRLDAGGYEYSAVRDEWVAALADAGITGVAEIEADTFGNEVMGSAREVFHDDVHGMDDPVVLFHPGVFYRSVDANWPETLPGHYALHQTGMLNEYDSECMWCEGTGRMHNEDEDGEVVPVDCSRCEGEVTIVHEGGEWALYSQDRAAVEAEEEEEEEEDEEAQERRVAETAEYILRPAETPEVGFVDLRRAMARAAPVAEPTFDDYPEILDEIRTGIMRTIWAEAWSKWDEETRQAWAGIDYYYNQPRTEELGIVLEAMANRFITKVNTLNRPVSIEVPWKSFSESDAYDPDMSRDSAEHFGGSLVMEALGHGVGWTDESAHDEHGLTLPYIDIRIVKDQSSDDVNAYYIEFDNKTWPADFYAASINMETGELIYPETPGVQRGLAHLIADPARVARAREIIAAARADLGDLEGAELDLLADQMGGSLDELRDILVALGERRLGEEPLGDLDVLGAGGLEPRVALTNRFGNSQPLPWDENRAYTGWSLGEDRWIHYVRQLADGAAIYNLIRWDGSFANQIKSGTVLELLSFLDYEEAPGVQRGSPDDGPRRILTTYEIITPESAEEGDVAESGWEDEEGYIIDGKVDRAGWNQYVSEAAEFLNDKGADEPSSSWFNTGIWYTQSSPAEDRAYFERGEERRESYHLKGFTVEEQAAIFKLVTGIADRMKIVYVEGEESVELNDRRVQLYNNGVDQVLAVLATGVNSMAGEAVKFAVFGDHGDLIHEGMIVVPRPFDTNSDWVLKQIIRNYIGAPLISLGMTRDYLWMLGEDLPFVDF